MHYLVTYATPSGDTRTSVMSFRQLSENRSDVVEAVEMSDAEFRQYQRAQAAAAEAKASRMEAVPA